MFQYIHELEELEDILNTLVFEDEPTIFDEDNTLELMETALHLMEEYVIDNPSAISEPDFHEDLLEEIKDIFYIYYIFRSPTNLRRQTINSRGGILNF